MDDITGREIALRMRDPLVKYDEVYAEICRRFGSEAGLYRHRWKRVRLQRSANGVFPAEWRRFRVKLLSAMAQGFGDDEMAVREHVLLQLPESWRLAVIKQEMRRKANSNMVRVWVPQGEEADRLYQELCYKVEGLGRYEVEGRSIRVECHSRRSQSQMLE